MKAVVVKETAPGENRVALVPESVGGLKKAGLEVWVQKGAGRQAHFPDAEYEQAGAHLEPEEQPLVQQADILLMVQRPTPAQTQLIKEGAVLVGLLYPDQAPEWAAQLLQRKITAFSLERVPRISRAQKMDALSSQSTVAGYLSVLQAASSAPRFFPLLMTAAGTIAPARVLVLGVGVAGLQAIATAHRLGARVEAYDVRPAVKEQVESLGAKFVGASLQASEDAGGYAKALSDEENRKLQERLKAHVQQADVVITTALVPGKKAPVLVTSEMLKGMKPGSIIVDLAAEQGGNCAATEAGKTVLLPGGVRVQGPLNLPAQMPFHASAMYSRNITAFLMSLVREGKLALNFEDEVIGKSCIAHQGQKR